MHVITIGMMIKDQSNGVQAEDSLPARPDAIELRRCPDIIMLRDTPKGRGIFATARIPARTVIDVSPVLVFEPHEYENFVGKSRVWFYSL